jgi:hypothetical protein
MMRKTGKFKAIEENIKENRPERVHNPLKELFRSKWSDMIDSRWALGMITGGKK